MVIALAVTAAAVARTTTYRSRIEVEPDRLRLPGKSALQATEHT